MQLRPYQARAVQDALYAAEMDGKSNIILEAPTSAGKSLMMSELASQLTGKVLILVNITPLIDQIADHLDELDMPYSILKAGYEDKFDSSSRIHLVMSQTYYARKDNIDLGKIDYVIQDECHKEWLTSRTTTLLTKLRPTARFGFSGTCFDESGYALTNSDCHIQTISIPELEQQGFVSKLKYFIPKWSEKINYDELRSSGSDYSGAAIDELIATDSYSKLVVQSMNQLNAKSLKCIVFANSIAHADKLANALITDGYKAYSYHSENESREAELALQSFKSNEPISLISDSGSLFSSDDGGSAAVIDVRCLVSVSKVAIGFDVPDIDLGVLCRPTKVLSLYRQQVGRIIRKSPNKTHGIILDLAGCVSRHGFHDEPYTPPAKGDKRALLRAQEALSAPIIEHIVGDEPTEITRDIIVTAVEEARKKAEHIPELTIQQLIALFETTTSISMAIWVGFEMQKRKTGAAYDQSTISWCSQPWFSAFEEYPDEVNYFRKAAKTRIKNIVRDGKKMVSIKFFIDFLIQSMQKRRQEPYQESVVEINDEDIPF